MAVMSVSSAVAVTAIVAAPIAKTTIPISATVAAIVPVASAMAAIKPMSSAMAAMMALSLGRTRNGHEAADERDRQKADTQCRLHPTKTSHNYFSFALRVPSRRLV